MESLDLPNTKRLFLNIFYSESLDFIGMIVHESLYSDVIWIKLGSYHPMLSV